MHVFLLFYTHIAHTENIVLHVFKLPLSEIILHVFFCNFFFFFLGPQVQHMEAPRLGVEFAVASGLRHSHSNAGSEPSLQPLPWFTAAPDPLTH